VADNSVVEHVVLRTPESSKLAVFSCNSKDGILMRELANKEDQLFMDVEALNTYLEDKKCMKSNNCYQTSIDLIEDDRVNDALRRVVTTMRWASEASDTSETGEYESFGLRFSNVTIQDEKRTLASGLELIYSLKAARQGFGADILAAFPRDNTRSSWVYVFRPDFVDLVDYFFTGSIAADDKSDGNIRSQILAHIHRASKARMFIGDIKPSNIIVHTTSGEVFFVDFDPMYTLLLPPISPSMSHIESFRYLELLHMVLLCNSTAVFRHSAYTRMNKRVMQYIAKVMQTNWFTFEMGCEGTPHPDWFLKVRDTFNHSISELQMLENEIIMFLDKVKQTLDSILKSAGELHLVFWDRVMHYNQYEYWYFTLNKQSKPVSDVTMSILKHSLKSVDDDTQSKFFGRYIKAIGMQIHEPTLL
jgi:hypothetical protein